MRPIEMRGTGRGVGASGGDISSTLKGLAP